MNEYVTYAALKTYLRISEADSDALLRGFATQASRVFDQATRRRFYPRIETRSYDHPINANVLVVDDDLLTVETFTTGNGGVTLAAADYFLMCGREYNLTPYDRIVMRMDGDHTSLEYLETPQQANTVAGVWGYHEDWAQAWDAVDVLAGDVNDAVVSLAVVDADGADLDGSTPRFAAQQLIQVGTEYMAVTGVTAETTNTLAVRRGVNGTSAAAHASGDAVSVYRPMVDVVHAVRRLAAWMYGQKDQPYAERIQAAQQGIIMIPEGMPADVQRVIRRYAR